MPCRRKDTGFPPSRTAVRDKKANCCGMVADPGQMVYPLEYRLNLPRFRNMFTISRFHEILKYFPHSSFEKLVKKHGSDKYSKGFGSWSHLVAMLYGQLSGGASLWKHNLCGTGLLPGKQKEEPQNGITKTSIGLTGRVELHTTGKALRGSASTLLWGVTRLNLPSLLPMMLKQAGFIPRAQPSKARQIMNLGTCWTICSTSVTIQT